MPPAPSLCELQGRLLDANKPNGSDKDLLRGKDARCLGNVSTTQAGLGAATFTTQGVEIAFTYIQGSFCTFLCSASSQAAQCVGQKFIFLNCL